MIQTNAIYSHLKKVRRRILNYIQTQICVMYYACMKIDYIFFVNIKKDYKYATLHKRHKNLGPKFHKVLYFD